MRNRFSINEEEKNRIRGLHLTESKDNRITSIINESQEFLYEGMDESGVDAENMSAEEEDWMGDWDTLDDEIKNVYRKHDEFSGMDESQIKEKFNAMDKPSLCKIARFMFGWVARIFKPLSWFDKQQRGGGGMGGSGYKPAWRCR
tara:strand:- start:2178 stop:2612 length:435 start_codon:yes stop_codon:yes gene_type:complete